MSQGWGLEEVESEASKSRIDDRAEWKLATAESEEQADVNRREKCG